MTDPQLALAESKALEMAGLVAKAADYAKAAKAKATLTAYASQWRAFAGWCASVGACPLPASSGAVALFLTARAGTDGVSVATLAQALTAISRAHVNAGHPSPRLDPALREIWQGICRTHGKAPKQARPVSPVQLKKLSKAGRGLAGLRDRALLLVGFAAALRQSELVGLDVADVSEAADGLLVHVGKSKTDQRGVGRDVGVPYGSEPATCPVRALRAWFEASGIVEGAIFRGVYGSGLTQHRLSARDVSRILQRAAKRAGVDSGGLSGHSLRSGLVTAAAKAGKSVRSIQDQTGHKSVAMVMKYIRSATIFEDNAASGIGL